MDIIFAINPRPTKDLKKKGLRLAISDLLRASSMTNQRPEKEGIKTDNHMAILLAGGPTKDLKKKGLRRDAHLVVHLDLQDQPKT